MSTSTFRVAFVGNESLLAHCAISALDEDGVDVLGVATDSDEIRERLGRAGVVTIPFDELTDLVAGADILFSIANEHVLPPEVVDSVRHAVNFHDGPLPSLGGVGVTTWAIAGGATRHGISWHRMVEAVDAGEVLLAEEFEVRPDETALSLNARCFEAGLATFPALLDLLRADPEPGTGISPEEVKGRFERPIGWVDPDVDAAATERLVRALDLGPLVRNRLGVVRWLVGDQVAIVRSVRIEDGRGEPAGTVDVRPSGEVAVATSEGTLVLVAVERPDGAIVSAADMLAGTAWVRGDVLAGPPPVVRDALSAADPDLARRETAWLRDLTRVPDAVPELLASVADDEPQDERVRAPLHTEGFDRELVVAAAIVWWSLVTGLDRVGVRIDDRRSGSDLDPILVPPVAVVEIDPTATVRDTVRTVTDQCETARRRGAFLFDLPARAGAHRPVLPRLSVAEPGASPTVGVLVSVEVDADGAATVAVPGSLAESGVRRVADEITQITRAMARAQSASIADIDLLTDEDLALLDACNDTAVDHDRGSTVDSLVRERAATHPDAPAVSDLSRTLTYSELAARVDGFEGRLRDAGVRRGDLVGIGLGRDVDLVVAVLGVLSTGAAYVPLDPEYPEARLAAMAHDAGLAAVVATPEVAARFDVDVPVLAPAAADVDLAVTPARDHEASDAAYVIYTSGSTGAPKGVVLEHRNVVNFFVAMDQVIDHDDPGTWMAVTSLSFDISVLELLWTLTRGFHVVVHHRTVGGTQPPPALAAAPSWSLFFFAAGDTQAAEGYRLLLDSARFADSHGFEAVWVPERHFHEFGAAYPNPSVAAAAIAAVTERVGIRAGSVVLPLHQPARVAEEWAVVDNLSGGRVGISFAAGWQPKDFVLNPGAYATARTDLAGRIDQVRSLWRGDAVELPGHDGEPVEIVTLPRPVQPDLPTWMTSAGSTATFEEAGRLGHNVLTHLLGQSIEQLADNIRAYRAARREVGHRGDGHVTLMLHTHLDADESVARERAREPMRSYLRTATGLIKDMASAFPTFGRVGMDADEAFRSLTDDEMEQLLTVAAARYMETSGLFTTPLGAAALVEELASVGVDELACLVDFGVDTDEVLASLDLLSEAKALVDARLSPAISASGPLDDPGVGAVAARFGVTHLQCTPSLAEILLAVPEDRAALGTLRHMMVGGEALNESLAAELRDVVPGRLTNMYGPTETTIWSLVHEIDGPIDGAVPIGRPVANTTIQVLDALGRRSRIGTLGELHIGGEGLARGYLHRPDLTAERFVERRGGRMYATGDLARLRPDGVVEFGGRADLQVKIRGHRIELGEIEGVIDAQPTVDRSVVSVVGSGADSRLVAFVRPRGADVDSDALLESIRAALPEVMVPDLVHRVDEFALTPNGKIDRSALPTELAPVPTVLHESERPADDRESVVARAWSSRLGRDIGRNANVFEAGGNSLLAVAVFRELQQVAGSGLALTDLFRYPTVASLASHLEVLGVGDAQAVAGEPDRDGSNTAAADGRGARRRRARTARGSSG